MKSELISGAGPRGVLVQSKWGRIRGFLRLQSMEFFAMSESLNKLFVQQLRMNFVIMRMGFVRLCQKNIRIHIKGV